MKNTQAPTRFLSVAYDGSYGIRLIRVCVNVELPGESQTYRESAYHTARATGPFSGERLEDFSVQAYAGHQHPASYERPDEVWGWSACFEPSRIQRASRAREIAGTLDALDRATERIAYGSIDSPGAPSSFADYLRRMARILGCASIRIFEPTAYGRSVLGPALPLEAGSELVERIGQAWAGGDSVEDACRRQSEPAAEEVLV